VAADSFWNKPLSPVPKWSLFIALGAAMIAIEVLSGERFVVRGFPIPLRVIAGGVMIYGVIRLALALLSRPPPPSSE
jgi:hypothetical protein